MRHEVAAGTFFAAQALVENAKLVTVDVAFSGIEGLQTLWS